MIPGCSLGESPSKTPFKSKFSITNAHTYTHTHTQSRTTRKCGRPACLCGYHHATCATHAFNLTTFVEPRGQQRSLTYAIPKLTVSFMTQSRRDDDEWALALALMQNAYVSNGCAVCGSDLKLWPRAIMHTPTTTNTDQ